MSNNDFIVAVHMIKYEELLEETNNRSHLLNAEILTVRQQMQQAMARASQSAQTAVCRVGALNGTQLCPVPSS